MHSTRPLADCCTALRCTSGACAVGRTAADGAAAGRASRWSTLAAVETALWGRATAKCTAALRRAGLGHRPGGMPQTRGRGTSAVDMARAVARAAPPLQSCEHGTAGHSCTHAERSSRAWDTLRESCARSAGAANRLRLQVIEAAPTRISSPPGMPPRGDSVQRGSTRRQAEWCRHDSCTYAIVTFVVNAVGRRAERGAARRVPRRRSADGRVHRFPVEGECGDAAGSPAFTRRLRGPCPGL
jgi:hypothetical protein